MAPTPQEHTLEKGMPSDLDGERVVISGVSGLYPQSHHVKEFSEILYNKVNPVVMGKPRWKYDHPEVPQHTGVVPELDRFDAQFFMVHYRLGNTMDSMGRKVLEQAYQAIFDAGVSSEMLSGKNVGVYIGTCFSESEKASFYDATSKSGFGIAGCSKTMFANRISYWLNAKGPSMSIDESCCSSLAALEQAYLAMRRGDCEAAIVGGANLCLHPQSSVHYGRLMTLCKDGKTKSFDQNADGCARSEAINVLFLQKAKDALRIYADVLHVKSQFTSILKGEKGPKYGFVRNPKEVVNFLTHFYDEAEVPPEAVEYIEAFGSAVPDADKAELDAIDEVFCKQREEPLLVGSVTSNMGYSEAASGISGITKVLLGYQKGELAANLHCETPREDVDALRAGRMRIVTEHSRFRRSYAAVNGLSVSGINAHVLLHGHYRPKDPKRYLSSIPHLVTISGRQESAVQKIIDDLKSRPIDPEELALFHNIHEMRTSGHMGRGFAILDTNKDQETVCLAEKAEYFDDAARPLWFVYSGMGSQWSGMGKQLMRIPIFAAAIERCHRVLEPKGVDIVNIITSPDKTMFNNILHSFVGIAAIQIGLTDILREMGLVPDKVIGHSVGELGCAYADGCFTAEEMILSAYSRGLVSVQTPFIHGSMAAVGIGYQQISKLCPPEIEVACHNGPESSTISGPADAMREFVAKLTADSIFAKEVPCSNIAYHSRYIAEAGPKLLEYLSDVIKTPKARSDRWVSTSIPQEKWGEENSKFSSAWYHTNNLLNPVLFEETSKLIPSNAVLVEVAPHGLLQAILKRSLSSDCRHVPLTKRNHPDNALFLLEAIGKLYMEGYNPKVKALYPKVEFPVSTGTPLLSHLVEWSHTEKWKLPLYISAARKISAICKFVVSIHDDEHRYLQGNVIRGKMEYPFAAALVAVWDTLAMSSGCTKKGLSVQYRDIQLFAQPMLLETRHLRFKVTLHRGTGRFEVMDEHSKVAAGFINALSNDMPRPLTLSFEAADNLKLDSQNIYELLKERDYSYSGEFRSIHKSNMSFTGAQLVWNNNWVTLIDGMLQLNVLRHAHDTVSQPSNVSKLTIDVKMHASNGNTVLGDKALVDVHLSDVHDFTRCGGVLLENIRFIDLPSPTPDASAIKALKFVPHFQSNSTDLMMAFKVYMQIVAENINKDTIRVVEVHHSNQDVFDGIREVLDDVPGLKILYQQSNMEQVRQNGAALQADVVLVKNLSADDNMCQVLHSVLDPETFIVNGEESVEGGRVLPSTLYRVLSGHSSGQCRLELARWKATRTYKSTSALFIQNQSDIPMLTATRAGLPPQHKLLVFALYPPAPGLKDLIKQWRKEPERNQIYLALVSGNENLDQLPDLDLAFNVLDNDVWGGEYFVPWQENVAMERGVTLQSAKIGDLDTLQWVEMAEPSGPGVTVTVRYAGLNDLDVKRATGIIPFDQESHLNGSSYGMDFSGTTNSGERVMGIVRSGAASGRVRAPPQLLWPVPAHWTLEDAATVPSAYAHAFYCLGIKGQLIPGMTVLVHGGAGALGQAAISIALANGCQVFTTVGNIRKKHFLRKLFPELKEEHIGNSRDNSFGDMVLRYTDGEGCDIIISCVKGELKDTTLKCASYCGITFDTAQAHCDNNYAYGMFHMTKQRSYVLVDFQTIFEYEEDMKELQRMMSEGIAAGYVRPLSRVTYPAQDAPRALRLVAASRHRGRVLLRLRDAVLAAQPRLACSPDLCHLVICDKDSFGVQLANRLVSRGARKLRLHYAQPPAYINIKIQTWQKLGVQVDVSSEDLSNPTAALSLLCDTIRNGPIEGIYVTVPSVENNESYEKVSRILTNLDLVSRESCPSLKYFAVVSADDSIGITTCLNRVRKQLPATILQLPTLNKDVTWHSALDAAERAVRSTQPILRAHPQQASRNSLLHQIAAIADMSISSEFDGDAALKTLGLDYSKLEALCTFLLHTHSLSFTEEQIPMLTVNKIKELEEALAESAYKEIRGLETFFSFVDSDELLATTEIVYLPTQAKDAMMRDDEVDMSQRYMCIVPGMEGHYGRFRVLCERLKLPALVLQPGLDNPWHSLRDMAERYAKILKKKTEIKDNFYLLGYESGVLIALEIASILEEEGLTGTVFCVGGSPDEIRATLDEQLRDFGTEEALQDAVVQHMSSLMAGGSTVDLTTALRSASSWQEKVDSAMHALLGHVEHSTQYAQALIEAAYARIVQVRQHSPQPRRLRSRLVLLHSKSSSSCTATGADALQQYSQRPIAVYELEAPLVHAVWDPRCAAHINRHLDADILRFFDNKNLCETYLLNVDTFMSKVKIEDE